MEILESELAALSTISGTQDTPGGADNPIWVPASLLGWFCIVGKALRRG